MSALGGVILMFMVIFFILSLVATLFGGLVGLIVGMVFPFVPEAINQVIGLQLTGFEIGAVLGFVGSFFRTPEFGKQS